MFAINVCCQGLIKWEPIDCDALRMDSTPNHELDDFEKEQDEDDGEDEAEATSTVVSETWTHAVTTEAEQQNQNNQKDKHFHFLRSGENSFVLCDADFVLNAMV